MSSDPIRSIEVPRATNGLSSQEKNSFLFIRFLFSLLDVDFDESILIG